MKSLARFLLCTLLLLSLTSCGGGGGGSDNSPPPNEQGDDSGSDDGGDQPTDPGDDTGSDDTGTTNHRIAGTVTAERFSDTDSDSNDPQAPIVPNNQPSEAQLLGNPVVLGGFASAEGSGQAEHRFQAEGDSEDWFSLSLSADQSIRLTIHDFQPLSPLQNDLDLYLYQSDAPDTPVQSSTGGISDSESIRVPASGDYLLEVRAVAGISAYTLKIDSSDDRILPASPSVGDDFAPGELIVKWKQAPTVAALNNRRLQPTGSPARGSRLRRYRLADFADSSPPRLHPVQKSHPQANAHTLAKLRTLMELKQLQADPAVDYVEPNYRYYSLRAPSDPLYLRQWHYRNVHLPEAWDITTGSADTVVAVLDTGIYKAHPDFGGKLTPGYDFISDPESAGDGDGIDDDPEDPGDQALQNRSSWHGTHVAGTVGAFTDNTSGVSGAGWQSLVMPLRVLGISGGSTYDVAQAVRYAAGLANDSGAIPAQKAGVINMSFGGSEFSQTLQDALSEARAQGVVLVAAAGNDSSDTPTYPAAMEGVIAVSATDFNNEQAPYSNFGNWVDLAAPGGDMSADANVDGFSDGVLSTYVNETKGGNELSPSYASLQGTSMASPHASGVFALMKAVNPQLTPDDIDALLASGQLTTDLGETGRDPVYGYGLLDAYKAVQAAGQEPAEPVITADPETLNFSATLTALEVEIRNIGADGAAVSSSPQPGAGWISSVEPMVVDTATGFGTYRVTVDRTGLTDGIYNSEVVFPMNGTENYHLPVNLQVGSTTSGNYAGYLYILLLKASDEDGDGISDYETVRQLAKSTDNGEYTFEFTGVEPGNYTIAAGSDLNANGTICDPGEACGYYPASGQEDSVTVDRDLENLSLIASYYSDANTSASSAGGEQTGQRRPIGKLKIRRAE
ncbi:MULTISPECIES: S8 family serine peptidase [unclassified Microbulbifer]|uniref:S8 family serine peptidase n=1 Tax=unclassified Microbulbifer TaxID=2619833 RepID=UPI0027E412D2|nr:MULTISPECIES: S8 family serine peptidase [unclassified Microbulbifer]